MITLSKPDRTWRINIEKQNEQTPILTAHNEQIITLENGASISNKTADMSAVYNADNPLDVALYTALEAKILEMRFIRDNPPVQVEVPPII